MILGKLDLEKIGERLKKTDCFLLDVLAMRLAQGGLSDCVAESKRRSSPNGIFNKRRQEIEDKRIALMKKWAIEKGIDQNFAASILYAMMSESCRVQDEVMVAQHQSQNRKIDETNPKERYDFQRENLLSLTRAVAEEYDQNYGTGFLGSKLYFSLEKKIISGMISSKLPNKNLAIDLGCATGIMSFEIAHKFKRIIGYDISPDMVRVAKNKLSSQTSHVDFVNADVENGIDLPRNSVSLAIMNMGTAGDVENIKEILESLKKILEPGGRFFLSFYNSESLLQKIGFIPWPVPLAAHMDTEKQCLEVRYGGKIYFLYAKSRSVKEVQELLSEFEIENILTFPTLGSILPNIITENEEESSTRKPNEPLHEFVRGIDTELASSALYCGTYIIITGGKK